VLAKRKREAKVASRVRSAALMNPVRTMSPFRGIAE